MAKDKTKSKGNSGYIFAAILLALVCIVNIFLVREIYTRNVEIGTNTSTAMNCLNKMNSELADINKDTIGIAAGINTNMPVILEDTERRYKNIVDAEREFESLGGFSDEAMKRYEYAKAIVTAYKTTLDNLGTDAVEAGDFEEMGYILKQDIYPLQVTASEMLVATIDIVGADNGKTMAMNAIRSYLLMGMMVLVAVLGEIAILIFAKRAKKARLELEERERKIAEVDAKLKTTRQKASDLAVINVLTGLKNRYALDSDITDRLESDRFQVAVFDMDNFRSINDTYGYDFGDEYLAAVAERLKEEFSEYAEIYNITGNEFCFVFNKNVSESQAMGITQNIQRVMSSPYEVLNLTVQLPCSGAVYHYLPGDCLNVNSLLVKLDTAMRNAKMNGGNMISTVMNI